MKQLTLENLQSIEEITQILPIKGYNHVFNLPLWFSSKENANLFLNCIKGNYSHRFELDRVEINIEETNGECMVNFVGTKNVNVFLETFIPESNKRVVKFPLRSAHVVDFNKKLSEGVVQGEYAITSGSSNKPILGTHSAGPCLIVAIYDKKTETIFLAHIDGATDLNSLKAVITQFNPKTSQVHLYGGDASTEKMCMDIFEIFKASDFEIYNSDIVRTSNDCASLAIDSRTGKIYSPVRPYQLETPNEILRLQLAGLIVGKRALRKVYDGGKEKLQTIQEIPSSSLISNSLFSPATTSTAQETYCEFKPCF